MIQPQGIDAGSACRVSGGLFFFYHSFIFLFHNRIHIESTLDITYVCDKLNTVGTYV